MKRSKAASTGEAPRPAPASGRPAPAPAGLPPPASPVELRVAVDKKPYAEIIGHAVVEPDVEVCGVLVGRLEQDAHGPYVHVSAAIRGEAAKEQGAAVTFTHETWNHIHGELDRRFPDLQIVGWYHTHGGFGVFLSDMDVFVHDNFFPEKHHVAYVYDPLAGSEGFFHRTPDGLKPVARYFLGGRERRPCTRPPEAAPEPVPAAQPAAPGAAQLEKLALALQAGTHERSSPWAFLPWAVAIGAVLLLLLEGRGANFLGGRGEPQAGGVVAILDRNGTGQAVGIPLEALEQIDGSAYRDRQGNVRPGIELRAPDGSSLLQPGLLVRLAPPRSEAELAHERERAEAAERDRASLLRLLAWVGGGVLAAAGLLFAAWWFVDRRR